MDSLQNILGGRDFTPPGEIELIQDYVQRRYSSKCRVYLQRERIIISVRSSALANTLRLEQQRLIEACNLEKKLIFRIS